MLEFPPKREWYLPFQKFRYKLVKLIDELLEILKNQEFYFTFDGQTIILEDYLEIRPEKKDILLHYIRDRKIRVGPWYLLPDIWLVGQESILRNLEYSYNLCKELNIPFMKIAYLPDMFGHSKAIPQLLGDITDFTAAIVWRGVPPDIKTVPFLWKGDKASTKSIFTIYLPFGYGNAAGLPEDIDKLTEEINTLVNDLKPFSPLPSYLLQYGTDHQVPNRFVTEKLSHVNIENTKISLGMLEDFVKKLQEMVKQQNYSLNVFSGEFRSSARAHLLQDTYSARMWIKQWNQRIEDLLIHYAEPLNTYLWKVLGKKYPTSFLKQAWKWHLRNQPHDSICGCSIDQTHEEMKIRYYWGESLAESFIDEAQTALDASSIISSDSSCYVFNPTNCSTIPMFIEFTTTGKEFFRSVTTLKGEEYKVQPIQSLSDVVWEMTTGALKLRALMKMFSGRQIMRFYINNALFFDGKNVETCEVHLEVGDTPVGEFDVGSMKKKFLDLIDNRGYKKFHIIITKELKQTYAALLPLKAWSFTKLILNKEEVKTPILRSVDITKNSVSNDDYKIIFNKDGTFNLIDKSTGTIYEKLHQFEDWGDRGDEYTFGRLSPERAKIHDVKRIVKISGPVFSEIQQTLTIETFQEVDPTRQKRIGKSKIPVETTFRFFNGPRIDIQTKLTNTAKDHRLRICFDLPFTSEKTITSTHFGFVKRYGSPIQDDSYIEQASGIQPQKRFIRVEDPKNKSAITLINQGLPEVELVEGSRLSLTLIRSIGWLSRSDIPERPEHAGPFIATPGAQELGTEYTFNYSFFVHSKDDSIIKSADHSEIATLSSKCIFFQKKTLDDKILEPLIEIYDQYIRISSIRVQNEKIWVTMYNMSSETINTKIKVSDNVSDFLHVNLDGSEKGRYKPTNEVAALIFKPHEIKICSLE
ncbi:MAG: glycoside hydrolase family 38 C-terminal domain-containing protein [Candidatus Hodarchaeota archaeon]